MLIGLLAKTKEMRYVPLIAIAFIISFALAEKTVALYDYLVPLHGTGFFLDLSVFAIGIPLGMCVLLPFFITLLGDSKRQTMLLYTLAVMGGVEFFLDIKHVHIVIGFFAAGICTGWIIRFILSNTVGRTGYGDSLKKYF